MPIRLKDQRTRQSPRVGREEEGLSSNRPELVALWECLETHQDHENLLYLTDSETTILQVINTWIGGGTNLSLPKTTDTDILRSIVIKLQKRVKVKAETLLIKVKSHHGCPINEETDISVRIRAVTRVEMGRMKVEQEKTWSEPSNRTIYQWYETSKTKNGTPTTKQSAWTQAVSNRMRPSDRKQSKSKVTEHMKRERKNGAGNTSHEKEKETSLKKDRIYWKTKIHDGTDQSRQRTPQIGSSGKGEGRELLGEWMKLTSVRSQDQRRMLQATSHNFQTNDWIHRITKGKESDKYDLCETLWPLRGGSIQDGKGSPRTNPWSHPESSTHDKPYQ